MIAKRLLPAAWVDHKRAHYLECWRELAQEHKQDRTMGGPRHAEMLTDAVIASAKWLVSHEHLPESTLVGWPGWREELEAVFQAISPRIGQVASKPRHAEHERTALFGLRGDRSVVSLRAIAAPDHH